MSEMTCRCPYQAQNDQYGHVGDEEVGGDGKESPGLTDSSQIAVSEKDDKHNRQRQLRTREPRKGRDDGVGAGRNRDGHCDRVTDEKGGAGNLGDVRTEVVPTHYVGAACLRIRANHIAVADRHDSQNCHDGPCDGRNQGECNETPDRD